MKRCVRYLVVTLSCLLAVITLGVVWPRARAPLPDSIDSRLIVNARILDVANGKTLPPTRVLIERGVITAIGDGLEADSSIPLLDAGGRYLSPGFWDMHTHALQLSPQLHLPLFVANGVTGVRDMMGCPESEDSLLACSGDKRAWTKAAAAGTMSSPRFVELASFYFDNPEMAPDQAAALATTYHERGVDTLKVYNRVAKPAYLRLAAEGRRIGMPLVGHLPKAVDLNEAVTAGQRSFEHAHLFVRHCFKDAAAWRSGALDGESPTRLAERMVAEYDRAACDKVFSLLRANGSWFVPTHVTREEDARAADPDFLADPRLEYLDPLSRWAYRDDLKATSARYPGVEGRAALRKYFDHGLALTGAAHRAGVQILVGTDTGIGGFRYHDEMAWLVRAGMSPAAVVRAATLDAARYAQADDRFGSIAVGKVADVVLLEANPFEAIANTRRIWAVLLGGRLYDRDRLDSLLRFTRDQAASPANWIKLVLGFLTSPTSKEL